MWEWNATAPGAGRPENYGRRFYGKGTFTNICEVAHLTEDFFAHAGVLSSGGCM